MNAEVAPGSFVVVLPGKPHRGSHGHGTTVAKLVRYDGEEAVIRRLRGFAVTRVLPKDWVAREPALVKPVRVERSRIARAATPREVQLHHPEGPAMPESAS